MFIWSIWFVWLNGTNQMIRMNQSRQSRSALLLAYDMYGASKLIQYRLADPASPQTAARSYKYPS